MCITPEATVLLLIDAHDQVWRTTFYQPYPGLALVGSWNGEPLFRVVEGLNRG
jgi:hypothetical protein